MNKMLTKENCFQWVEEEFKKAVRQKSNPFRTTWLATSCDLGTPSLRMLVLRDYKQFASFLLFTDQRSQKWQHIQHQSEVELGFFNPQTAIQVRAKGLAKLINSGERWEHEKALIPEYSRKEYALNNTPGESIKSPFSLEILDEMHFGMIEVNCFKMDVLSLQRDGHIRIGIDLDSRNKKICTSYLTP